MGTVANNEDPSESALFAIIKITYRGGNHKYTIMIWPRGYKTFFMLNSTEHKISTAHTN